jgi:hypothetical protein
MRVMHEARALVDSGSLIINPLFSASFVDISEILVFLARLVPKVSFRRQERQAAKSAKNETKRKFLVLLATWRSWRVKRRVTAY